MKGKKTKSKSNNSSPRKNNAGDQSPYSSINLSTSTDLSSSESNTKVPSIKQVNAYKSNGKYNSRSRAKPKLTLLRSRTPRKFIHIKYSESLHLDQPTIIPLSPPSIYDVDNTPSPKDENENETEYNHESHARTKFKFNQKTIINENSTHSLQISRKRKRTSTPYRPYKQRQPRLRIPIFRQQSTPDLSKAKSVPTPIKINADPIQHRSYKVCAIFLH